MQDGMHTIVAPLILTCFLEPWWVVLTSLMASQMLAGVLIVPKYCAHLSPVICKVYLQENSAL